jgi:hypothetical protein
MDGLMKRMAAACSEAGVEAAACSGVGDEDNRWRWQCDGF